MAPISIPSWLREVILEDNTSFPVHVRHFTNDTYKVSTNPTYGLSGGIGNTFGIAVGSTSFSIGDMYYCDSNQNIYLIVNINPSLEPYEIEEWVTDEEGLEDYKELELYNVQEPSTINILSRLYLISLIASTSPKEILQNTIIDIYNRFVFLRTELINVTDGLNIYRQFENAPLSTISFDIFNTTSNALFIDNSPTSTSSIETLFTDGRTTLKQLEAEYPELRQSINIVNTLLQSLYKNQSYVSSKVLQAVVDHSIYPATDDTFLSHLIDYEVSSYTALGHLMGMEMLVTEMLETPVLSRTTVFDGSYSVSHDEIVKGLMYADGIITSAQISTDLSALYTVLVSEGLFAGFDADIRIIHSLKQNYTVMTIYDDIIL